MSFADWLLKDSEENGHAAIGHPDNRNALERDLAQLTAQDHEVLEGYENWAAEMQLADVWRGGGDAEKWRHGRTGSVDKSRNGRGAGQGVAFTLDGPCLVELGILAPGKATGTQPPGPDPRSGER